VYLKPEGDLARAQGVARVTVFDEAKVPLAERVVYRNRRERLDVQVKPHKPSYVPRDQVSLQITTTDGRGKPVPAVRGAPLLAGAAVLALCVALVALLGGDLKDPATASVAPAFWRDATFKQFSGYGLVAAVLLSLAITWRKRVAARQRGDTAWWRIAHVGLAVFAGLTLLAHTGGRIGENLNFALSATFLAALLLGAISALAVAREHRGVAAVATRRRMTFLHLTLTWPLPALLAAHIVKAYFF
jgi:nitrite reductase (NADH) large subunit